MKYIGIMAKIAKNQPAELTLFSPHTSWNIEPSSLKSLSMNTPWLRQEIVGRVIKTYIPLGNW